MERILFSFVGMTDPIKGYHDGPLIHIVRHYRPQKVYAYFSKETGDIEREFGIYSKAVHLVDPDCIVESLFYDVVDVSDFDIFSKHIVDIFRLIEKENPLSEILVNMTSGTLQMISSTCLLVSHLNMKFRLIQVKTPEKSANRDKHLHFDPKVDPIEDYYEGENLDVLEGSPSRCHELQILSYKKTVIKSQIESLIKGYDYDAAEKYLIKNSNLFEAENYEKAISLLKHARLRINFECKEAEKIAQKLNLKKALYPIDDIKVKMIVEYYLIMNLQRQKKDMSSFVLKLSPLSDEIARYILIEKFGINISQIAIKKKDIYKFDQQRSENELPGISAYLDEKFKEMNLGVFLWDRPLNFASMISFVEYLQTYKKPLNHPEVFPELKKWQNISKIRNMTAHTLTETSEHSIATVYGDNSKKLCSRIEFVLKDIFKGKLKEEIFAIYDKINEMILEAL
ncbi:hypothetical protein [Fusibacter sp. 3D3]|uniref:type III-A CRISPR-associated CARF protein Csm6 n=1 Tax=Fusibacter sp. 3D3 TaxID=1048380 RepID=UPI000852D011|nr:hypothetical protein [Fusibacter sp. 3D3]GAU79966.1 CRISPR-associated protein Csm6 [Fusibacter sp. 3D3]